MLCGIPCAGKSTYIQKLKETDSWKNSVVLSTDNYIESEAKRLGLTYNDIFDDTIESAVRDLEIQFNMAKEKGKNIIWDQTNLTPKTRKKKLSKVPSAYKRTAVYFQISLEEALERNKFREGKFIPENVLKQMHNQFMIPTLEEGFDFVLEIK